MTSIAVTGSAGAIGLRVVRQLAAHPEVDRVVAIDRERLTTNWPGVEAFQADLLESTSDHDMATAADGVSVLIHLAERDLQRDDPDLAARLAQRAFGLANRVGCRRAVVLSSAMVYGAHDDNPIPLTESEPVRPNTELSFATTKLIVEEVGREWEAAGDGRVLTVMRPTTTLSERGSSWVAKALRTATTVRSDHVDPPVQFLHHDDLASAIIFAVVNDMGGVLNVAPDGWIGPEAFRELVGGLDVRVPTAVNDRLLAAGRRFGVRPTPPGIEAYVRGPWVVANDRLRSKGWTPAFSNEEAYVLGTPPPPWSMSAQKRQELALGAAGMVVAGTAAAVAGVARRFTR